MTFRCADPSFGISPQALAILQLMAGTEPHFADFHDTGIGGSRDFDVVIRTYPWYNGLERGAALVVQRNLLGPCLVVTFGEHSSSDHIFVDHWMLDRAPENGPRVEDVAEEGTARALFKQGRFDEVVGYTIDVMEEFYTRVSSPPPSKGRRLRAVVQP